MNSGQRSAVSAVNDPATELHIEFDGGQLTVLTELQEVRAFLTQAFRAMLVPAATKSAGTLHLYRIDGGYALRGDRTKPLDFSTGVESIFHYLRHEIHIQFVRARPDLLWLHAGAVADDGGSIVIPGRSGEGKSTLVALLCERGWHFLSDDVAPVRMDTDEVVPYPQSPLRRMPPTDETSFDGIGRLQREAVSIPPDAIRRAAVPLKAIVFPFFHQGREADFVRLPEGSAALELLRNCTSFSDQKEVAVARASMLARAVPAYRLSYGAASEAARLIGSLDRSGALLAP